jgi:hypothetical protein
MKSDRRNAILLLGAAGLGAAMTNSGGAQEGGKKYPGGDKTRAPKLSPIRCFCMAVPWDGTDRRIPASVEVKASKPGFKSAAGVYIQQSPGQGNWDEIACFSSLEFTDTSFTLKFTQTGGQNYNIFIPVTNDLTISDVTASTSGPLLIQSKNISDVPFP